MKGAASRSSVNALIKADRPDRGTADVMFAGCDPSPCLRGEVGRAQIAASGESQAVSTWRAVTMLAKQRLTFRALQEAHEVARQRRLLRIA
ncbi:hypothetical protein GCM10007902_12790 [Dyella nitratireducens]|nr:hypothetical protein GCM10007902_12790 [Dyella nitratireducens]